MKTVNYSLSVLMLVILFSVTMSGLLAQGRSNGNGNNNQGRGHGGASHPRNGRVNNDGNVYHGSDNDRRYDRGRGDRNERDHFDDGRNLNHHEWNQRYPSRDDYHFNSNSKGHRYVTYNHHRHGRPSWAPAFGHRYNTRYIYYQDYNVYYDCQRDLFLTWTGRTWVSSTRIPDFMFHVNFGSARVYGVDYWDNDLDFYLQRRRPSLVSISAAW